MEAIVWLFKLALLAQIVQFVRLVAAGRRADGTLVPSFSLFSAIEIGAVIALTLTALLSDYNADYAGMVLIIVAGANLYAFAFRRRTILIGDQWVILKGKLLSLSSILAMKTNLYAITIVTCQAVYKVIYPIIRYDVLETRLYRKVGKQ